MNKIVDKPFLSEDTTRTRWYLNGKLPREDGPAFEWPDGSGEWYLNGQRYTEEEYVMIQFMNGVNLYADNC